MYIKNQYPIHFVLVNVDFHTIFFCTFCQSCNNTRFVFNNSIFILLIISTALFLSLLLTYKSLCNLVVKVSSYLFLHPWKFKIGHL